jgi:hypothetical protein
VSANFTILKVMAREWRVKATCSQADKHWIATGKFSLTADAHRTRAVIIGKPMATCCWQTMAQDGMSAAGGS